MFKPPAFSQLPPLRQWTRKQIEEALEALPGSDCSKCVEMRREWLTKLLGEVNRS